MKIPTWYKWSNLLLVRYFLPHCGCRRSQSWSTTVLVVRLFVCLFIFLPMFGYLFDSHLCLGRGTMPGSLKTALPWARNKRNITWWSSNDQRKLTGIHCDVQFSKNDVEDERFLFKRLSFCWCKTCTLTVLKSKTCRLPHKLSPWKRGCFKLLLF